MLSGLEIFVFKGDRFLGSRCFSQPAVAIGSGASAHLKLNDKSVSENHALARIEGGHIVISDAGSAAGLTVNGKRVAQSRVGSNDEVLVGAFRLKIVALKSEVDDGFGDDSDGADSNRPTHIPGGLAQVDSDHATQVADMSSSLFAVTAPGPAEPPLSMRQTLPTESMVLAEFDHHGTTRRDTPGTDPTEQVYRDIDSAEYEYDDGEDEHDEDEDLIPAFSLLENVVRERFKSPVTTLPYHVVEMIRYKDGELLDVMRVPPGKSARVGVDEFRLLSLRRNGKAQLFFRADYKGTVIREGRSTPLSKLALDKYIYNERQQIYAIELEETDYAQILLEDGGYLVRFVAPPQPPQAPLKPAFQWRDLKPVGISVICHIVLLVGVGLASGGGEATASITEQPDRFAQIELKEVQLEPEPEPPPPEPKPPEEKQVEAPAPPEAKKPEPKPKRRPEPKPERVVKRAPAPDPSAKAAAKQAKLERKQVGNLLSALQAVGTNSGPGRSDIKALASNIAAVRAPAGTASDFKVAGVIGKLPGNSVRFAGAAGGGSDTKTGSQLLRGSSVGAMRAKAGTGTNVRGRVAQAPTRAIGATGGSLSREAIQRVVSQHMAAVQACYERQLITNPGLSGKVVFDWVISPSGSVTSARQVSSSIRSPAVASCILAEIKSWRFPQPTGGSVQVRYPFVFRIQGF